MNHPTSTPPRSAAERVGAAMLPFAASTPVAVATALGIRNESLLRTVSKPYLRAGAALTGRDSSAARRRREAAAAQRFRDSRGEPPPTTTDGVRPPVVNWHQGGAGPALLLLNGFTASGLVWPDEWVRRLEARYRVIRIDNRGTGWSRSAPAPFTLADLADDARGVLAACGIEQATVLGVSMGGMIAQELALRHPDVVDSLVLVGTRPPTPAQIMPNPDAFQLLLRQPRRGVDLREFFRDTWSRMIGPAFVTDHPAALDRLAEQITRRVTPRSGVLNQGRAMTAWHGPHRLARITARTTIVHGTADPLVPVGNGMRLSRLIPGSTYIEVPGAGHLLPYEAGDVLMRCLEDAHAPR